MRIPTQICPMTKWKQINSLGVLLVAVALVCSCSPNQRIVESNAQLANANADRPAATPMQRTLEQDIDAMRTADFIFIYVIKRKDGAPLDNEDRQFASSVIPGQMNRKTVSSDGKAILVGSNFILPEAERKLIEERFALEDLSRNPEAQNQNTNVRPTS
jgi:hypothetical protein